MSNNFLTRLSHLIILVEKKLFRPHFAIQVSFINNISGESIVDLGLCNLMINYFLSFRKIKSRVL